MEFVEIRLSDPAFVPSLLAALRSDASTVARCTADATIEATLLGSYRPATMRTILAMRVWEWQVEQAAVGHDVTANLT